MALKSEERFGNATEMLHALESGPAALPAEASRPRPLYQRNPLLFWQVIAALQIVLLLWSIARH